MKWENAQMLNKTMDRELQCLVKRVPSMYSAGVFICNQAGVHALLSTIMPLGYMF
jgi:hypothetical protein